MNDSFKKTNPRRPRPRKVSARPRALRPGGALPPAPRDVGEEAWIEVIHKMDQVYNDLLKYEVQLEEKNAALEDSQKFIYSVLDSISDVLIVCDRSGRIQDVNPALSHTVGCGEAELKGTLVVDLFADEASRRKFAELAVRAGGEAISDCEIQLRGRDGAAVPVTVNCTPRFNSVGKMVGMVLTGRPLGELRRAYQQLRQAHEELKRAQQQLVHSEKMASLGLLVAGVAHELNNPISFVLGNAHALKRYLERLRAYLEAVHSGAAPEQMAERRRELRIDRLLEDLGPLIEGTIEGAERTRDIVDGLKRFSAVDRDESKVFNLAQVVARSVHWVARAAAPGVKVSTDLPPELPVTGSAGQMQQVVVNLMQNALDSVGGRGDGRIEVRGAMLDGEIQIEFLDNGPGIPATILSRVFDPFFTTKPVGKGTGLGLSISYGIVERHGGRLTVGNRPEGGAVFTLVLPQAGQKRE